MLLKIFVGVIKLYQYGISPYIGHHCRFHPTCSAYAIESLKTFGILKGSIKSIFRIARCGPWSKGGFDPVIASSQQSQILTNEVFNG